MPASSGDASPDRHQFTYSIVIPVFNSEELVGTTVDHVVRVFTEHDLKHEVILVNDGSRDGALVGFCISALSMLLGAFYLVRGLLGDSQVEGWTSLIVLLAIFNGFTIALLSMLGEYVVRTLNAVSSQESYHVTTRVPD